MTRTANARAAGFTFLFYIAAGMTSMVRSPGVLLSVVLSLCMCFSALVLAVTLYRITRDQDPDLALLGLVCRAGEGVSGAVLIPARLALRSLQTAANGPDAAVVQALGAFFLKTRGYNVMLAAAFFAVGSTLFSWLFLRGRMIPVALAWLGLIASVLLVICLPLQLAGVLGAPITTLVWLPMLAFEVPLGFWLLIKGAALPARRPPA